MEILINQIKRLLSARKINDALFLIGQNINEISPNSKLKSVNRFQIKYRKQIGLFYAEKITQEEFKEFQDSIIDVLEIKMNELLSDNYKSLIPYEGIRDYEFEEELNELEIISYSDIAFEEKQRKRFSNYLYRRIRKVHPNKFNLIGGSLIFEYEDNAKKLIQEFIDGGMATLSKNDMIPFNKVKNLQRQLDNTFYRISYEEIKNDIVKSKGGKYYFTITESIVIQMIKNFCPRFPFC